MADFRKRKKSKHKLKLINGNDNYLDFPLCSECRISWCKNRVVEILAFVWRWRRSQELNSFRPRFHGKIPSLDYPLDEFGTLKKRQKIFF